jgi:hypothetical protein
MLAQVINKFVSIYDQSNTAGRVERFNLVVAGDFDTSVDHYIANLVANNVDARNCLYQVLAYHLENFTSSLEVYNAQLEFMMRKLVVMLPTFVNNRGNITGITAMFNLIGLGFNVVIYDSSGHFDRQPFDTDGTNGVDITFDNDGCNCCVVCDIELYDTWNVLNIPILYTSIKSILKFNLSINTTVTNIYHNGVSLPLNKLI